MLKNLWQNHRVVTLLGAALLLAGGAAIAYSALKRPADVSNADAVFVPEPQEEEIFGVADWPVYGLDPERTRYLPTEDVKPPYNVAWKVNGRKLLEYSPIIAGNQLFAVNNNGMVFSAKTRTGKIRWRTEIAELNASSPAWDGNLMFVATLDPGQVVGMNAKNGVVRWKRELPGRSESSPVVVGNKVIVGCECGTLYAFDRLSGKTIWEADLGGPVKAAPAVSEGIAYVGDYSGQFSAVRVKDGSIKWQTGAQGAGFGRAGRFYATAAVGFGRVYVGSIDSRMYSFEKETGELAWSHSTNGYVYAAAVLADSPATDPTVYFGSYDGTFYALDARSGNERWTAQAGGPISGAASMIGETVYVANLKTTDTFGYNAANGEKVFEFHDGAYNPVVSDGRRLYLTGYKYIYALQPVKSAPQPAGGGKKGKKNKKE